MNLASGFTRWQGLICFTLILCLDILSYSIQAQESATPGQINNFAKQQAHLFQIRKDEALRQAISQGWVIRQELPGGGVMEIMELAPNGMPEYNITGNVDAAITSGTSKLWPDSASGLDLAGAGFLIGEWDGGRVRRLHQEFNNGSGPRVTLADGASTLNDHSTHVAGTLIAKGQASQAHGMAPEALLRAYDWNDDVSEMATAYANYGLNLSNHSYGRIRGWYYNPGDINWYWYGDIDISPVEDYQFGFYGDLAVSWDSLAHLCPYYLIVLAAGNDRDDSHTGDHFVMYNGNWTPSNATRDPDGDSDGYDCILNRGVAKNVLTVGAINDIPGGYTTPGSATMTVFSNWGPTDDGRIKPDIVANGAFLYSSFSTSNSAYNFMSGTSMAAPTACGTIALLQDYYHGLHGSYLRSSVMKAVVINTAFECGSTAGPDYAFGWGLLNAIGMADMITQDYLGDDLIMLNFLFNTETETYTYYSLGDTTINVTICWTDPPGTPVSPSLNPTTSMLVHDLDMRIIKSGGSTYSPWVLNPAYPSLQAGTGDNYRDNVEKVTISNPTPGEYVVQVNHKGTIAGQYYGMAISGLTSVRPTNYWTGISGTGWNTAANWSLGHEPVATEHVIIPSGCPDYPILNTHLRIGYLSGTGKFCHSLVLEAGASLTIQDLDLYSTGMLTVQGDLYVGDDFFLNNGSTTALSGNGRIYTGYTDGRHGLLSMASGSIVNQTGGEVNTEELLLSAGSQYNGSAGYFHIYKQGYTYALQYIQTDDPDSYFYNFHIDTLTNVILHNCAERLTVTNIGRVSGTLNLNGDTMNVYFMNVYGEIEIPSGLLNITQTSPVFYNNSILNMSGGTITSFNSIWFNAGSNIAISGGIMNIRRDMNNQYSEFSATGGSVRFYGDAHSQIRGVTTFFKMEVDKDPGFVVYCNNDAHIKDSLIIKDSELIIPEVLLHVGEGN